MRIFYGWWIVAASSVGLSTNPGQFAFGAMGLFIVPLAAEFGWQRSEISFALTLFTAALAVSLLLVGRLVDRFGSKTILLPSAALFGLLLLAVGLLVTRLWQLYLLFILIGSLAAGANALPYLRIIGAWFNRRRGLAFGLAMTGGGLGYAYVPPLVQYLIDGHGWRSGYLALGAIVLLLTVPLIALLLIDDPAERGTTPDGRPVRAGDGSSAHSGATAGEAFRSARLWWLFAAFASVSLSLYGLLLHLVPMLTDRGMPGARAALVASVLGIAIVVARIGVGYLIDRIFAPYVALSCFLLSAGGLALFALGGVGQPALLGAVLVGLSIGAELDLLPFLASRYFGLRAFGTIYGLLFAAFLIGTSCGPLLFAFSFENSGSYVRILWVAAGLMVFAAAVMAGLPRYPRAGEVQA